MSTRRGPLVTEDLRAVLRAELGAERPPPLGDVVGAAMRDGRRIRLMRRIRTIGAGLLALAAVVTAFVLVGDCGVADRRQEPIEAVAALTPQTVPPVAAAPIAPAEARTLTIRSGTASAGGTRKKATAAAMLHLLLQLVPPGRTSHLGVAADDDLQVQLYLDAGSGPGAVRVEVDRAPFGDEPRGGTASVTITHMPDNCVQSTSVGASWPDGTLVRVDVASCLTDGAGTRPARPALTVDQAVRVAADPRWGVTMDERLVTLGAKEFPRLPVFAR
ncbi:hypothetical protein ACQP2F_24240 [Actinoplanes sp. CA-030573]|uniref:hypothetical protein n=1 Tax=Actinoplanes sp. CA-030573 TaxID=3239898 RepID=UPI003D937BD7